MQQFGANGEREWLFDQHQCQLTNDGLCSRSPLWNDSTLKRLRSAIRPAPSISAPRVDSKGIDELARHLVAGKVKGAKGDLVLLGVPVCREAWMKITSIGRKKYNKAGKK